MFRKRFALKQQWKKHAAAAHAIDRDRRRSLGIPARILSEAELDALQPFANMFDLHDNLEEWLMELSMEWDNAEWMETHGSSYRY